VVLLPGGGDTTVVRAGGCGSLLLNDTQPASETGTINNSKNLDMTSLPHDVL
jgi:hypothetical protein